MDEKEAIVEMHHPHSRERLKKAKLHIIFDDLSDYVKYFVWMEKGIRGEKMSYWSFVHGTVTVLPFGRTQAEKRYLLDTVLDHLPKVTGSEGDMNIYCIQKMGILSRVPIQNLENKSRSKHFLQKCRVNIFWS